MFKTLQLPSVKAIEDAIRERRGEIAELREMLRLARVREIRSAAGLGPARQPKGRRRD